MEQAMKFDDIDLFEHPLVRNAFELANEAHAGDMRGTSYGRDTDTITHPAKVAELLQSTLDSYNPELIAAALTHDVVEDTDKTLADIKDKLNSEVACLVDEVSVDNDLKGIARREFQLACMDDMSLDGKRLKVADCTINLLNMAFDSPEHWTAINMLNYLESRRNIINASGITDLKLITIAKESIDIAERATFVAIRERAVKKGFSSKVWNRDIKDIGEPLREMLIKSEHDLEIQGYVFDDDGLPIQLDHTLDDIYSKAPIAQKEISTFVARLSDMCGCKAIIPEKLKERSRAEEVVETRFDGDASRITDVARVALVCKTMDDVNFAMHSLHQSYKNLVMKDRFTNPPTTGYRDICMIVRTDNSRFAEVQIHLESYWNAKKHEGDDLYSRMRALHANSEDGVLSREDKKERRKLYEKSRKLYKKAGEIHGFTSSKPQAAELITYDEYQASIQNTEKQDTIDKSQPSPNGVA